MTLEMVDTVCLGCREHRTFVLEREQFLAWKSGMHLQNIFPDWLPEDREQLISGTCPDCWEDMWAEEEEEEEEDDLLNEGDWPEYQSDYYVDVDCN